MEVRDGSHEDLDRPLDAEGGENCDDLISENINVGVLLKFEKKKSGVYYVAKVMSRYNLTVYQVSYLRKIGSCVFVFPSVEALANVDFRDVVLGLLEQHFSKSTSRTSFHVFS